MKSLWKFCIVCILVSSLINASLFGNISLSAYFGFCIFTLFSFLVFSIPTLAGGKKNNLHHSGFYNNAAIVFLLLATYVFIHGLFNQNINLSHYFWLSAAALLLLTANMPAPKKLHTVIVTIALIESLLVFFQWLQIIPSLNAQFAVTGSWANPNVTAMFLALSLWSQKEFIRSLQNKYLVAAQLIVILIALLLLQCRSAYIVAAIILFNTFSFVLPFKKLGWLRIPAILLLVVALAAGLKKDSTGGRLQILKNSVVLLMENPVVGTGFGEFEKSYNLLVSQRHLPSNDHVGMAYNDFLELGVEGGIIALVLWVLFLVLLVIQFRKDNHKLSLVAGFIAIQLTNFGFQAIPVFALFLVYVGFALQDQKPVVKDWLSNPFVTRLVPVLAIAGCLILFVRISNIAGAFYTVNQVTEKYHPADAIDKLEDLGTTLNFSANYHESFGDLYMRIGNFRSAMMQYRSALRSTSRPVVMGKCGWCYGQLSQYDSASYFFETIESLQPHKYAPRMALLKIYEQKKDTASTILKAREIMMMPVKVPSKEVDEIKLAAKKWWQEKI